jgi:redox-sensitive bicupin YhaK (pirin superfamily)
MISLRRAEQRHHQRHHKRGVWRTFDPLDRTDWLADGFGTLEALDENRLPPRAEASRRAGDETEIVTYVREGTVAYEDSMGHSGVIHAGEFQRMTALAGTRHSETNASRSDWAHVFHVRLRCSGAVLEPGREQKRFSAAERRGGLCIVASPDARKGSLRLHLDARMYAALLEPGQHVVHELGSERAAWLHLVQGEVTLGDLVLTAGDGAGVTTERAVSLTAREDSEILMLDVAEPRVHPERGP